MKENVLNTMHHLGKTWTALIIEIMCTALLYAILRITGVAQNISILISSIVAVILVLAGLLITHIPKKKLIREYHRFVGMVPTQPQGSEKNIYSLIRLQDFKKTIIYALPYMISPFISLLLLPFLTHQLSRTDYGVLVILNTTIVLLTCISQLGIGSAFFHLYCYDYNSSNDRKNIIFTATVLISLVSVPIVVVVVMTATWLSILLFGVALYRGPIILVGLVMLVQNLSVPIFAWLRAENRSILYTSLVIGNMLINLFATIILVGILQMGINGSLIATGLGYVVVVCMLPLALLHSSPRIRIDMFEKLLTLGLPTIIMSISLFVLQLSDRYLLSHLSSLTQVASYSVAYILGGMPSNFIILPFMLIWPTVLFAIAKRADAARIFQVIFRWYSIVLLFATYAFSLIALVFLGTFFLPSYQGAEPVIPIITASNMFYALYVFFTIGILIRRKTWLTTIFIIIAALVNIGLNLVFIPLYGSMGAAISKLIAYIVLASVGYIVSQRVYPIPFEVGKLTIAFGLGVALFSVNYILAQTLTGTIVLGISVLILILYSGFLFLLGKPLFWRANYLDLDASDSSRVEGSFNDNIRESQESLTSQPILI